MMRPPRMIPNYLRRMPSAPRLDLVSGQRIIFQVGYRVKPRDRYAVLAFRGSDPVTLPNWVTDVVVKLVECREYQGRKQFRECGRVHKSLLPACVA